MNVRSFGRFDDALESLKFRMRTARSVHAPNWQGMDVSAKPDMMTRELLNESFAVMMHHSNLDDLRADLRPNLPWADDHFEERVGRKPLNPGEQWAHWPFARSAARFLKEAGGKFTHTYMERFWPKHAGDEADDEVRFGSNVGIRYAYGDLDDVVRLLRRDPLTRQAYLPIFFPEDTGATHGGRIPCSIGYHFILRQGYLHCVYQLRSCDFVRHLRDDLYLATRLTFWLLDELRLRHEEAAWQEVAPGYLVTHITSLHIFEADVRPLFGGEVQ
jgi:hypothetical protein